VRYLQLAFNDDAATAERIVPTLPRDPRILIEAGTPFIKLEGMAGVRMLRLLWPGGLIADLKTTDGGTQEVAMVAEAGASAATVYGSCPTETLDRFIEACRCEEIDCFIDMLGVADPLHVMRRLRQPPSAVVLHRGRDEENTRGKVIGYKHVARIRSKYDVAISAAGGVDLKEARSAIFNGANIVVVNIVAPGAPWEGIKSDGDVAALARQFLTTIGSRPIEPGEHPAWDTSSIPSPGGRLARALTPTDSQRRQPDWLAVLRSVLRSLAEDSAKRRGR